MKIIKKNILPILFSTIFGISVSNAAQIKLSWDPNSEADLAGYRIFKRETDKNNTYNYTTPDWEGNQTNCTIQINNDTTSCFVCRAYNTSGNESTDSNEVCWSVDYDGNIIVPSQSNSWEFINGTGSIQYNTDSNGRNFAQIYTSEGSELKMPIYANMENWYNPIMHISAQNPNFKRWLEVKLEDNMGNTATYSPTGDNFDVGENYLTMEVAYPTLEDTNFNPHFINNVILSGPEEYNLERIVLMKGGNPMSGNMISGINCSNVNNHSDFYQRDNSNTLYGLADRRTRTQRYLESEILINDLNLGEHSELVWMFSISNQEYENLPSLAMELGLGDETHVLYKEDFVPGFNKIKTPITSFDSPISATLRVNRATSFPTRGEVKVLDDLYLGAPF